MPHHSPTLIRHFQVVQSSKSLNFVAFKADSPTRTRITIQIPRNYRREPVISRLTSHHGLTVSITGAVNSWGGGSFDLELHSKAEQIQRALAYLQALEIEIKSKPNPDGDGW